MFQKYDQLQDDPLKVKGCYTLKQDLQCSEGIFTKDSIVRILSANIRVGDWVFYLEGCNASDRYCLTIDKHTDSILDSIFEYNAKCTLACEELEKQLRLKRIAAHKRVPFYTAFTIIVGVFLLLFGSKVSNVGVSTIDITIGLVLLSVATVFPVIDLLDEQEHLSRKEHSKIMGILKSS